MLGPTRRPGQNGRFITVVQLARLARVAGMRRTVVSYLPP
jgi:hypothetical protein